MMRYLFLAGFMLALVACSHRYDPGPRIADLVVTPDIDREKPLQADTVAAIQRYQDYLATGDHSDNRAEAMRRVGDLELRFLSEREAGLADGRAPVGEVSAEAVARLYRKVLEAYPDFARNDQVMYQLAHARDMGGDSAATLAVLDEIVRRFPNSRHLDEVHFRRGEIHFVARRYAEAAHAYGRVVAMGTRSPFYAHALYKRGWSRFKLLDYPGALADFDRLILEHFAADGEFDLRALSRADREMAEDTLRVMALSFSYSGGRKPLAQFFATHPGRGYEDRLYAVLGKWYLDKERYTEAAETFAQYADLHPLDSRAPAFDSQAIEVYQAGGFPSQVLRAKQDFVEAYRLDGPYWQARDPQRSPQIMGLLKRHMTDLARHFHALAQKGGKDADYAAAIHWYQRFLASFPDAPESPEMRYSLGELHYDHGQRAKAVAEWERVAYASGENALAARAGYSALRVLTELVTQSSGTDQAQWRDRRIESALRFVHAFPQHEGRAAAWVTAARELLARGRAAEAVREARGVIETYPELAPELKKSALLTLAHGSFDIGDHAAAEQAYEQLLTGAGLSAVERRDLRDRLAAAIYKQGEAALGQGNRAAAAALFVRAAERVPESAIAATAEFDAAALYIGLRDWDRAGRVLESFRRRHPDSPLATEARKKLAVVYLEQGRLPEAAALFSALSATASDPAYRRAVTLQAAELYARSGNLPRANALLARFVKENPSPTEPAVEAMQQLADNHRKLGNGDARRKWLRRIIAADSAGGTARTRQLAARASLALAEADLPAYRAIRLVRPLKRNLKRKKAALKRLLKAFGKAADYGIAEVTTAATYRVAELYHDFGKALMASERPRGLDDEALEEYELMLEEEAIPFEEKAIETHEINAARVTDGIYDDWVRRSMKQLAELLPARYGKEERVHAVLEHVE